MRILAVDQSSSCAGWAVLDDEDLVNYGLIDMTKENKHLFVFNQTIVKLIYEYNPQLMAWEDLKTNQNADSIRKLGEFTGHLRFMCEERNIPYREAVPISVKAGIVKTKGSGTRGRKTKTDLARRICDLYGLEFPINKAGPNKGNPVTNENHEFFNITDAIGLGLYIIRKEG
ncbi:MAG: crossover junction endodeoxyribonuclease RuvC [Bacteroidota bacterium]|nr:crossover junction endodeoxyribonuclease RuvC [Bacteroidota bacterium]